jgi:DNA-binding PadR family transcriptional regulator
VRTPTDIQARQLLALARGAMVISGLSGRPMRQCVKHGWIAAEKPDRENGYRITPDGFRALAEWLGRNPWPDIRADRESKPDPPLVQQLRAARDEARRERDEAQRQLHHARAAIRRAARELEGQAVA